MPKISHHTMEMNSKVIMAVHSFSAINAKKDGRYDKCLLGPISS